MGRKKIQISRITDERNRQVRMKEDGEEEKEKKVESEREEKAVDL